MVKSLISWALVGVLTYAWYWGGYIWPYLQTADWESTWVLYTILVILIQRRGGTAAVGANVLETLIGRVKTIVGSLIGLLVSMAVAVTVYSLVMGGFAMDVYLQGGVLVLSGAILTSAMLGALDDATQ